MEELSRTSIANILDPTRSRKAAIFIYTPLCGTCKLAARMLEIVEQMLPGLPLYQVNINAMPELAEKWQVTSVPGLYLVERGVIAEKHFALHSVDFLYQRLKSFF